MILTRDPSGRLSGRKTVLATSAQCLEALGYRVDVAVVAKEPPAQRWGNRTVHHVRSPGLASVAAAALIVMLTRRGSLNECLFDSRRVRREVAAVSRRRRPAVVVADGLRTASPALASGCPVLVHLDDLLSDRYRAMAGAPDSDANVLGFYGEHLPRPVRAIAGRLAGRLLAMESRRMDNREGQVVGQAAAVATTSPAEATELSRRTGRRVVALPMAVDCRPVGHPATAPGESFVFLGVLDYEPNRIGLRWWTEQVRPSLDRLGGADVRLTVIGHDSRPAGEIHDDRIRYTGYVDDLAAELRRHRAMVVPVLSGAGIKTKTLDAFSVGLPVVSTSVGAQGLAASPGRDLLLADDPDEFAAAVLQLRNDPAAAGRIGLAGRDLLSASFSSQVLERRWRDCLTAMGTRSEPDRGTSRRRWRPRSRSRWTG